MYPDTILFIAGATSAVLAILAGTYLLVSNKKSKSYQRALQQETEVYDTFTTTTLLTELIRQGNQTGAYTELMTVAEGSGMVHTELMNESSGSVTDGTELMTEGGNVVYTESSSRTGDWGKPGSFGIDESVLEGRYRLKHEIHGGGMSRVFLAENVKLGNQWIIKYISNSNAQLANEENILKLLNHISLPRIVDIYHDWQGVYLVESYIEGVNLSTILANEGALSSVIVLDWAEQLAQVLSYLHRMEPNAVFHLDLKPSNIMVTYDSKLVLIDFGISKRHGEDDDEAKAVTYRYAAPEQLTYHVPEHYSAMVKARFGELTEERFSWVVDGRTDIYSLGVILFEIATGQTPTTDNRALLQNKVSDELAQIILKCMEENPEDRYQSVKEMIDDLQRCKGTKVRMARTLFMRKMVAGFTAACVLLSGGTFAGGYYVYGQENGAILDIDTDIITVSSQQSGAFAVEKKQPNGNTSVIDPYKIIWKKYDSSIAKIDGSRILGMNPGELSIEGYYRNKDVSLNVRVVEPMDGIVEISQRYYKDRLIRVFAGSQNRAHEDGSLSAASFVEPGSIDIAQDGTIYVADAEYLRAIRDGKVESIDFEPSYLTPRLVRCFGNDVYILTNEWEEAGAMYYGIIKLGVEGAEGIYLADAIYTAVEDFAFGSDGFIYLVERNAGVGTTELRVLDPASGDVKTLCELSEGTASVTVGEQGAVYLANPETGLIQRYQDGELLNFAGIENEKAFIDGTAPLFYMPMRIKYADNSLFVWDFNTLRQIIIEDGAAAHSVTLIGEASPDFEKTISGTEHAAEKIILPNSKLTDFLVEVDGSILLTDPKRSVIWELN